MKGLYLVILKIYFACLIGRVVQAELSFTGWAGETPHKDKKAALDQRLEMVSWRPRTQIYRNILSPEEADCIAGLASYHMKRSQVVGSKSLGTVSDIRTSYGTFLPRNSHPVYSKLAERVAKWTKIPVVNQEDMQVLRYSHGQKYGAHYDALGRLATVLIYLTDVEEGGETAFPQTTDEHWVSPDFAEKFGPFSDCAKGHLAFKPQKGDALLFYSVNPDQTQDKFSEHTGCPVISGLKWTSTIWIHPEPFRVEWMRSNTSAYDLMDPGQCRDLHPKCADWAALDQCNQNKAYMIGEHAIGNCRLSCKVCEGCAENDHKCKNRNRRKTGYLDPEDDLKTLFGEYKQPREICQAALQGYGEISELK